jgi:hypothetical protein
MAAWIARGLDPNTEINRAITQALAAMRHGR